LSAGVIAQSLFGFDGHASLVQSVFNFFERHKRIAALSSDETNVSHRCRERARL
jgi:hypothetical protein